MTDITLSGLTIYPIKSLDGVDVESIEVLPTGALANDRRFAIVDAQQRILNAKRSPALQRIASRFDLAAETVMLSERDGEHAQTFAFDDPALTTWLSDRLEREVSLIENLDRGFPDDRLLTGPTVISSGTIRVLQEWFPELSLEELRRRFRANLELDLEEPFGEERLVAPEENLATFFRVGTVEFEGVQPSVRCVVPTRDSLTGERTSDFQATFVRRRRETLPDFANVERYGHHFKLAINTRLSRRGEPGTIRVGDPVTFGERVPR